MKCVKSVPTSYLRRVSPVLVDDHLQCRELGLCATMCKHEPVANELVLRVHTIGDLIEVEDGSKSIIVRSGRRRVVRS